MPTLVFNALLSSFFVVKVFKGRWTRNPHYLAVTMVASVVALLVLDCCSPGAADSFVYGNIASFAGAWLGLMIYDRTVGPGLRRRRSRSSPYRFRAAGHCARTRLA